MNYFENDKGEILLSYEGGKTWYNSKDNVFCKKTNISEVKCLKEIEKLLNNKHIKINNKEYLICTPRIYKYEKNILYMEYCVGDNLEFYLRDKKNHDKGVEIINELIKFIIENKIYWKAFAPRNVLVGKSIIYFVDFEKGIGNKNDSVYDFLRNNVYEEYSLLLFKNERVLNDNDVFSLNSEKNITINIDDIKDARYKVLFQKMGLGKTFSKREYLNALNTLIKVEEPKIINDLFYFPSIYLYEIYKNRGLDDYCEEIIKMSKSIL